MGTATGERVDGPRKRQAIAMLANGESINKISNTTKLARSTVAAIQRFESASILQRKTILADQSATIAHLAAERLKGEISTMPIGSLIPAFGVSVDKLCALTQDPQSQINQSLHIHLESIDVMGKFNQMLAALPNKAESNVSAVASTQEKQISAKEIEPTQSE